MTVTLVDPRAGVIFPFAMGDGNTLAFDTRKLAFPQAVGTPLIYKNGTALATPADYTIAGTTITFVSGTNAAVAQPVATNKGKGDGVTTGFTVTPSGNTPTLTALYKTDWQGTNLLYTTPRTNNWLQSATLSSAPNVVAQSTVTAAAGIAPDGTKTAWKLAEDGTNAVHLLLQGIAQGANSVTQTVYAKAAERTMCCVTPDAAGGALLFVDLVAGVITDALGGATGTVTGVGNGWFKITSTFTVAAGSRSARVYIMSVLNSLAAYQGVVGNGILIWHPQNQVGTEGTADISPVTVASPVSVTDYSLVTNTATLSPAPAVGSLILWDGTYTGGPGVGTILGREFIDQMGKVI